MNYTVIRVVESFLRASLLQYKHLCKEDFTTHNHHHITDSVPAVLEADQVVFTVIWSYPLLTLPKKNTGFFTASLLAGNQGK